MSDTPRTDECWEDGDCNILLHARQLERELASSNTVSTTLLTTLLTTKCRELAEVTKQRDALVNAIRKHKETLVFMPDYCDVVLYKALEELEQGGAA